jgi:hypothetical protein
MQPARNAVLQLRSRNDRTKRHPALARRGDCVLRYSPHTQVVGQLTTQIRNGGCGRSRLTP